MGGVARARSTRNELIEEYDYLVATLARSLVRRFALQPGLFEDLCSAGYMGLVEAAERCSPEMIPTFRSYACIRIRGSMIDMLRSSSVLSRRSHRYVKAMYALQHLREAEVLEQPLLGYPDDGAKESLARVLDMAGKGALAFRLSTDEAAEEIENITDGTLPADECVERKYLRGRLEACIEQLPEKERVIIREYYFEDRNFIDIAKRNNGMNKSWVSKLHSRALEKLRVLLDAENI